MSEEIKVGSTLPFVGRRFRLLPKLKVIFGAGTTAEESPIEVSSPEAAYRVIRERYPKAIWEPWHKQYAPGVDAGYMFSPDGEHDENGEIALCFFAEQADVVHDEFSPRGDLSVFEAGWVMWKMAAVSEVKP